MPKFLAGLSGQSELLQIFRNYDWSKSNLGPVETWPSALRTIVGVILNSRFPMYVVWGNKRTFLYNDAFLPILGLRHPKGFAQPFETVWPEVWNELNPLISAVYEGKTFYFENARYELHSKGFPEEGFFTFNYSPIHDGDGAIQGLLCNVIDTTLQVKANDAKSAFLANMSHEIRTPLGVIMGFSDMARQPGASKEEITSYLGVVERNSTQVLRIIDDILDLAKVEAGRVELEIIEFSLIEFLADFSSLLGFKASEKGITFQISAETDLPDKIYSDPTRLRQVLANAVGNAIKFTAKGTVSLTVFFRDGQLGFGVNDTGRGISPEQTQKLFQAFVQADLSTTRKFGGTGLGLVLTKRLCQLMGGDYVLERSDLGIGSKFRATIRIKRPAASKIIAKEKVVFKTGTEPAREPEKHRLDNVSVLLVEDSLDNQVLVQLILERQGVKLDLANDGVAGVEKARSGNYDVVLMDIQMPEMDGHEAVSTLRKQGYSKPVVALTAHAMKEEVDRARKSGFTSFLSKPIQREALISMVSALSGR